ncbi:MAG: helix-turn-helix transcriptional regulator [Anaerovibrio sp.]|nr:helix-turn-helix transcriptional regulator [Anaerovibrio sp.]
MSLGKRIKGLRQHQELLQSDVAQQLGITQSQYSKLERDALEPSLEMIRRLAKLFYVSSDYLLEIDNAIDCEPTFDLYELLLHGNLTLDGRFLSNQDCNKIRDMIRILLQDNSRN